MKSEEEAQKLVDDTSAVIRTGHAEFNRLVREYVSNISATLKSVVKQCGDKSTIGEAIADGKKIADSMRAFTMVTKRHKSLMDRATKVVVHKNEVKAYDRMEVALDRLKKESKALQADVQKLINDL